MSRIEWWKSAGLPTSLETCQYRINTMIDIKMRRRQIQKKAIAKDAVRNRVQVQMNLHLALFQKTKPLS